MDNFLLPDGIENMGGGASFRFTDINNIDTWPLAVDGEVTTPITFVDDSLVFEGYATEGTLDFNEQYDANSMLYNSTLAGRTPIVSAAQTKIFRKMAGTHLIVFYTDNNGVERILGAPKNPCLFTFGNGSGQAGGTANGYGYSFSFADRLPAPVYNPVS